MVQMCFDTVAALCGQKEAGFEPSAAPSKAGSTSLRKTGERGHRPHIHVLQCVHWIYEWQSASTLLTLGWLCVSKCSFCNEFGFL
jgi:hypothetical protein